VKNYGNRCGVLLYAIPGRLHFRRSINLNADTETSSATYFRKHAIPNTRAFYWTNN